MLKQMSPVQSGTKRLTPAYKRQLRARAEARVEELLALLDAIDGDPDLEPDLSQSTGYAAWENQCVTWSRPAREGDSKEDLEPDERDLPIPSERGVGWTALAGARR